MLHFPRWKIILVCMVSLFGFFYTLPNFMSAQTRTSLQESWPSFLPTQSVNLGLDLRGGSHLLVEANVGKVVKERLTAMMDVARSDLRKEKIRTSKVEVNETGFVIELKGLEQGEDARRIIRKINPDLSVDGGDDGKITVILSNPAIKKIKDQTISQSIEIIRRRIDETGTKEPIIARQGEQRILIQLPGVDDPARIKELIGKTAKMTFHLVDEQASSTVTPRKGPGTLLVPMAENPDRKIVIKKRAALTGEMLTNAQPGFDQGRPIVQFQFDAIGAKKFCKLSKDHSGRRFATVLDHEVISAPQINEPICGGRGIITGGFTVQSANDLALLMRAGALPTDLTYVEERTIGPSLGADSVEAGEKASIVAILAVLIFMGAAYGLFGVMAAAALVVNMFLIFALLSTLQATLTMPGIAGIVLTVGMAVDANVLIFERIREELRNGRTPIAAVDAGYNRAIGTIVDANITTLIAALMLFMVGTGPVKGFSVTLGIGVMTSMFSAIMVTRLLVSLWMKRNKPTELPL